MKLIEEDALEKMLATIDTYHAEEREKTMTIEDMRKKVLDNFERAIKEDYKLRSQAEVHYTATFERISMAWELGIIDYETWLKLVKRLDEKY